MKRGRPPHISKETRLDIVGHYKYLSARKVAAMFGVSHEYVLQIVKKFGRKVRPRGVHT